MFVVVLVGIPLLKLVSLMTAGNGKSITTIFKAVTLEGNVVGRHKVGQE
jgi:hypothetical protein